MPFSFYWLSSMLLIIYVFLEAEWGLTLPMLNQTIPPGFIHHASSWFTDELSSSQHGFVFI